MSKNTQCRSWVLSDLSDAEFEKLMRLAKHIEVDTGEIIFQEGAPPAGLYLICSGKVKLVKQTLDKAKRQLLKLLGPGELLGEEALFSGESYIAHARTLEKTTLCLIEKQDLLNFIQRHPGVAMKLIEKLARELRGFESKLVEMAYAGAHERLARLLLAIANKYAIEEPEGGYIGLELSRLELAELAGISLETTIRTLGEFRDRGFVTFRGHQIIMTDELGLSQLAWPVPVIWRENLL